MSDQTDNLKACLNCFKRHKLTLPSGQPAKCHKTGLPLLQSHVEPHDCPLGRFRRRGLGDHVARVFDIAGITAMVKRMKIGNCGCAKRRAALNKVMPLGGGGIS